MRCSKVARKRSSFAAFTLLVVAALALLCGCSRTGSPLPGNVLHGKAPTKTTEIRNANRLTDGAVAVGGDHWESDLVAIFSTGQSAVEWDLGREVRVHGAYLQGDNNDEFFLDGSTDGNTWSRLWDASSVNGAGMRGRSTNTLDAGARYLKLTARGGDSAVSATELQVYETLPSPFPPKLKAYRGRRAPIPGEIPALVFCAVTAFALLVHRTTFPSWLRMLFVLVPIGVAVWAWSAVTSDLWPPQQPVTDAVRAISAVVAAAAVARIAFRPEDMGPKLVNGWLAAMALLAMTTFYNMWEPQFEYVDKGGKTWVHTWDMRVYFPTAKYFDELGFDGLYTASVAAYLEDYPNASERRIQNTELRDLRNYEMTTVSKVSGEIHDIKKRFSPERWELFKKDMSFFWKTMGTGGYLGSLRDHGGNATPAWLFVVHWMFRNVTATETSLTIAALLDPLLLLGFFGVVWRIFGLRTALVSLVIYGSSTFPWFGSNWAGSTLRNDWMVCAGLGACALRANRYVLGGVLLAGAAMIRAFPAVGVLYLVVPAGWWVYETRRAEGKLPTVQRFVAEQRPLLLALLGAASCVVILFVVSGLFFGFSHSWLDWAHKITMHSTKPNVNHVGLRTLIQYAPSKTLSGLNGTGLDWGVEQVRTLIARRPLYIAAIIGYTGLAVAALRGRDLRQAALVGLMMIPIYFYPSNYYLHYVFVLPLLIDYAEDDQKQRQLWALIAFAMCAVSASEYWGFEGINVDERYAQWSVGVLIGYLAILLALAKDASRPFAEPVPVPVADPTPPAEPAPIVESTPPAAPAPG
jgi:hypothetical protein